MLKINRNSGFILNSVLTRVQQVLGWPTVAKNAHLNLKL